MTCLHCGCPLHDQTSRPRDGNHHIPWHALYQQAKPGAQRLICVHACATIRMLPERCAETRATELINLFKECVECWLGFLKALAPNFHLHRQMGNKASSNQSTVLAHRRIPRPSMRLTSAHDVECHTRNSPLLPRTDIS